MGYDVHITRADDWCDSESNPITLDEWTTYVAADSEMRLDNFAEAEVDGSTLRYENQGLAVWTGWSRHEVDGNMAWFDWRRGRIVVKNPDDEILDKMIEIAKHFSAHVFGDDGEEY